MQERDVEAHTIEGTEQFRLVQGLYELAFQKRLVLGLALTNAPEVVRAQLPRVEVLRTDYGDDADGGVQSRRLDVDVKRAFCAFMENV